jgi:hypothetical protein
MQLTIHGQGFTASVSGHKPWCFSYVGSQTLQIQSHGQQLVVQQTQLRGMPEIEQEQVFDAFWTLAKGLGFEQVCICYRVSDPYETFVVRPHPHGVA